MLIALHIVALYDILGKNMFKGCVHMEKCNTILRKVFAVFLAAVMVLMVACSGSTGATSNNKAPSGNTESLASNKPASNEPASNEQPQSTAPPTMEETPPSSPPPDAPLIMSETVKLTNTYTTKYGEVYAVEYPAFSFDYPDNWQIFSEEVFPMDTVSREIVVIVNDRGVDIRYMHYSTPTVYNFGGGTTKVEVSKVSDSNFSPGYVQATNHSDLGAFMVAKLNVMEDSNGADADGLAFYAVLPETQIGTHLVKKWYAEDFSFEYSSSIAFFCNFPPDKELTAAEEQEVIAILASFRADW
jgi:hypothetical protein